MSASSISMRWNRARVEPNRFRANAIPSPEGSTPKYRDPFSVRISAVHPVPQPKSSTREDSSSPMSSPAT